MGHFSLTAFKISLPLCFRNLIYHVSWHGFLWFYYLASYICRFMTFAKFGKSSALFPLSPCQPTLFFFCFSDQNDRNVRAFVIFPRVPEVLFFLFCFVLFILFPSAVQLVISILVSNSLTLHPLISVIVFFSSEILFCFFIIYIFFF